MVSTLKPGDRTGGARRSAQILTMLKNIGEVDLIFFKKKENCFVSSSESFPIKGGRLGLLPFSVKKYFSKSLKDYVKRAQYDYDCIFIDHSHLLYLFQGLHIPCLADLQNIETRYYYELGKCTGNPLYFIESFLFNFYEKARLIKCDIVFTPSLIEKEYLSKFCKDVRFLRHSYGNIKELKNSEKQRFIAIGNFDFPPNLLGMKKLINLIPNSKYELCIAGKKSANIASEKIKDLGEFREINNILKDNDVLLYPVEYGAGARVKLTHVFEGGLPFISTWKGVEGYPKNIYECGIIVDDINGFPDAMKEISNPALYSIFKEKIQILRGDYSLENIIPAFKKVVESKVKRI